MRNHDSKKNLDDFFENEIVDAFVNHVFKKSIHYYHNINVKHVSIINVDE